jgi:diaminopimelate decarboxylase
MNQYVYHQDALQVENVPLHQLAEQYGTPLYVYSKRAIIESIHAIEETFGGLPHLTYYAIKANDNPTLLKLIAAEGLGADVGSRGELHLALAAGFPAARITFSGVGKRDDEIAAGLEQKILAFNVESTEEIEVINQIAQRMGTRASILLRMNLDIDAGGHAYVSTSMRMNKFGIPYTRAVEVLKWASGLSHIDVRGVHSHIGSQILRPATFLKGAETIADVVQKLRAIGIAVHDIDFGGGFGVQYHGFLSHPGLPQETSEIPNLSTSDLLRPALDVLRGLGCTISIQPGRSIVAHSGALVCRVLYRKETGEKTFIIVDGAMNDLIRPSLYHSFHQIVPLALKGASPEVVDVVGPVCESGDFFAKDRTLPRMQRGDLLALMCTGAYGHVLSSNYNARLRPAEVLVSGTTHTIIRERERLEDLYHAG